MQPFPKYESYKDSRIAWLGKIPSHWELRKHKYFMTEKKAVVGKQSSDYTLLSLTLKGVIARDMENPQGKFPAEFNTYKIVSPDDLIFCLFDIEETPRTVGLSQQQGMITGAYTVMECLPAVSARYLSYFYLYLDTGKKLKPLYTGLRKVIQRDAFMSIKSPLPPRDEQDRIANFLDQKTTEIDAAVAKKQRLIELLKEQKTILINQAVTKGLNPDAPMRDSGVEWIGKVPTHWGIKKLKYLSRLRYGLGQPPREKEDGLPLIRATNVERGKIVTKNLIRVDPSDIPYERDPVLTEGDIIVVRSGAYTADSAIVTKEYEGAIAGYDMVVKAKHIFAPYLAYSFLASYVLLDQLYLLRMRAAQPHLNVEELGETLILVPPLDEQKTLVLYLNNFDEKYERVVIRIKSEMLFLTELKSTLIAEAVTGKIKI